jgi:DNA-directed RNA polymerase specialized sigma24 family protein
VQTVISSSTVATDRAHWFTTTRWSVVLAARHHATPEATPALEALCATYWYPLYGWLRRQGHGPPDAQDLTQSFFAFLLERDALQTVHPDKGRFRSFLLASLKHFVANEWDRARALKRGGGNRMISLDDEEGEVRFRQEPSRELPPDKAFEQSWAMTLFGAVLGRLREDYAAEGKVALYDVLHPYLTDEQGRAPYAEVARRLGLGEGAARMTVLRMRRRFGELLRAEIAQTVNSPEEVDQEIRSLLAAVTW